MGLAIHGDFARAAGVDGSEFAALQKRRAAGFLAIRQLERRSSRHCAGHHHAIEIGEQAVEPAGLENAGDQEGLAQFRSRHAADFLRAGHAADDGIEHDG